MDVNLFDFLKTPPPLFYTRGGEALWEAIRNDLKQEKLPTTAEQLKKIFRHSFEKLTGKSLYCQGLVYVENLDHGGMSGGYISPGFFNDAVFYFLEKRFSGLDVNSQDPKFIEWSNKIIS